LRFSCLEANDRMQDRMQDLASYPADTTSANRIGRLRLVLVESDGYNGALVV
jgi:hypothetical protein